MAHAICSFLKPKIKEYVDAKRESLRWFSRQAGVDSTTIYRLADGEQKSLSFLNASKILKLLEPTQHLNILGEFYPDETREVAGSNPDDINKRAEIGEAVLKDFMLAKVYTFASTLPEASREKVTLKFGTDGSDSLDKLITLGALSEVNGMLLDNIEGAVLLSNEAMKQNAKYNVDAVDLLKAGSAIHNIRANLNDVGLKKWHDAEKAFRKSLHEIADNEELRGTFVVVASSVAGPI